jgi:hypothetical protein
MKRMVATAIATVCLLLAAGLAPAYAAPVPEGFAGVPWGATRQQVFDVMKERGFTTQGTIASAGLPPGSLVFRGTFDGVPCQLEFYLQNNALYAGQATHMGLFTGHVNLQGIYKQVVGQLGGKYGPPEYDARNEYGKGERSWRAGWNLADDATGDKFAIGVVLDIPGATYYSNAPNPNKPEPSVTIAYTAVSLKAKLQKRDY